MSGLYPETTGFLGNNYTLGSYRAMSPAHSDHPSIGGFLRRNGYVSARVSKIYHMGVPGGIEAGEPGGDDPDSWDLAFDVWAPETGEVGKFRNLSPARPHWGSAFVKITVPDGQSATQADEMTVTQAISILETRTLHRNETNRMKPGASLFLESGWCDPMFRWSPLRSTWTCMTQMKRSCHSIQKKTSTMCQSLIKTRPTPLSTK